MRRRTLIQNQLALSAPLLSLILLLCLAWALPNRAHVGPEALARRTEVATALRQLPLVAGEWIGRDTPVPQEAQKLLKPNAIVSRAYHRQGGGPVYQLLVVHCGDSRDMVGHYPPVCYPSAGWVPVDRAEPDEVELRVGDWTLPCRVYHYRSIREQGGEDIIRIFNAFVLPDGTVTAEIDDMNRLSERAAVAVQGVAQVQVIMSADVRLADAQESVQHLLSYMSVTDGGSRPVHLFETLRMGARNHGS